MREYKLTDHIHTHANKTKRGGEWSRVGVGVCVAAEMALKKREGKL